MKQIKDIQELINKIEPKHLDECAFMLKNLFQGKGYAVVYFSPEVFAAAGIEAKHLSDDLTDIGMNVIDTFESLRSEDDRAAGDSNP